MLFFRVENDKHEGPYNNNNGVSLMEYLERNGLNIWGAEHDDYMRGHPRPDCDWLLAETWNAMDSDKQHEYIFGFESLDSLFKWFCMDKEIEYLERFGFHVSIYESDDCYHGKWQSIARYYSLKLVDTLDF